MLNQLKISYSQNAQQKHAVSKKTLTLIAMMMLFLILFLPDLAFAEPWDNASQKVLDIFTGPLTRTLAIIAIIACGIAALAGKLAWNWVINIVIGLVLIFGGTAIIDYFASAIA